MFISVSIIVPVYHGQQYIVPMLRQIEANADKTDSERIIELLFINDDPTSPIKEPLDSEKLEIRVLNTDHNRGIHGARVYGLKEAKGEYILFLDQDDRISPVYLKSQLDKIGKADAVVCQLIEGGRIYYDEQRRFENAVNRNHVIEKGNTIVSPGQVLLKKKSISNVWQDNILKHNGSDDWLLWICMLSERKIFRLNYDILFEHIIEGNNASLQTAKMIQSEQETVEIMRKSGLLSDTEIDALQQSLWKEVYGKLKLLDKFRNMVSLYAEWLRQENRGKRLADAVKEKGFRTVAIYGNGLIGKQIENSLKGTGVLVRYFIDRRLPYLNEGIKVHSPIDRLPEVDMVLISLVEDEREIREMLRCRMNAEIWTIREIIFVEMQDTVVSKWTEY